MKPYNRVIHTAESDKKYKGIVAAYMRYSSDNQDEHSIEYQRDAIVAYCQKEELFLCAEYWDEACTGTNDRRSSFRKMIADAHNVPLWDTILVFDYSRWFRDSNNSTLYECQLFSLGIDVFSITEQFDTSSEGMLMRDIKKAFNAFTSRNIGKFTHAGMRTNASKCEHCGGKPPLGYDVVDKKLVVNDYEAEIVRRIFELYENNFSYNQMAEDLNSKGYRTKFGKPFNCNSFSSILHQEKYIGTFVWNKTSEKNINGTRNSHKHKPEDKQVRNVDAIPAIISKEQFDRVQKMFADRQHGTASSKSRQFYLLGSGGFLKCAECGALMVGCIIRSHNNQYKYYYCPNHKSKHAVCSNVGIKAKYLERFVINVIVSDISKRKDLISLYNTNAERDKMRVLKNQINGLKKSSDNLINEIASGKSKIAKEDLRAKLNDVVERRKILTSELEQLTANTVTFTEDDRRSLCEEIAKMMYTGESLEIKKYLKETIAEIKVSNTDVEVTLNIA